MPRIIAFGGMFDFYNFCAGGSELIWLEVGWDRTLDLQGSACSMAVADS
jgi:hypothetical protein